MALNLSNQNFPFPQLEKNIIAFKGIFGILNTTTFEELLSSEKLAKGFNIYTEDILSETINFAATATQLGFDRTRTWAIENGTGRPTVNVVTGEAGQASGDSGAPLNPNVEKILIPLTKVKDTTDQLYVAFTPTNEDINDYALYQGSNTNYPTSNTATNLAVTEIDRDQLSQKQNQILKNFINPNKFGEAYKVKIYQSATNAEEERGGSIGSPPTPSTAIGKQHGGAIFDYKDGALIFSTQTIANLGEQPDLSGFRHPLWLEAYRYKGTTGLTGGITEITGTTVTNLDFNATTNILSIGAQTVNLGSLGTSFEQVIFTEDFATEPIQMENSIAILYDADDNGAPYVTGSYESWALLNTIHLTDPNKTDYITPDIRKEIIPEEFHSGTPKIQFPYGYAIGFSSSLNSPTGSVFPQKTIDLPKFDLNQSSTFVPDTQEVFIDHEPHRHGMNWSYVTASNGKRFLYDPSGKNKETIANDLRDFINISCSDHLTASVFTTSSTQLGNDVPYLTVKQIFEGMPSWYYTNERGGISHTEVTNFPINDSWEFKNFRNYAGAFVTSSQGNNKNAFGASIYPLRFSASQNTTLYVNEFSHPTWGGAANDAALKITNGPLFKQYTPNYEYGTLEFQKSLFHLDEKLETGSRNTFNTERFTFLNQFTGDWPDGFFNLKNVYHNLLHNQDADSLTAGDNNQQFGFLSKTGEKMDANGTNGGELKTQGSLTDVNLPSLIINRVKGNPTPGEGGPVSLRAGARSINPFGGVSIIGSNTGVQQNNGFCGRFSAIQLTDFGLNNIEIVVPYGYKRFPITIPTGSDFSFGQNANVTLDNGKGGMRNPSRRSIIKKYQLFALANGYDGFNFGLKDFVPNNPHAVLEINVGFNSIGFANDENPSGLDFNGQPILGTGINGDVYGVSENATALSSGRNLVSSLNKFYSSSLLLINPNTDDEVQVEQVVGFANQTKVNILQGQPSLAVPTISIITDLAPTLGGSLNLNGQSISGIGNIDITGDITANNIVANTVLSSSGNLYAAGNLDIDGSSNLTGDITTSNISASGHITASSLSVANNITASGDLHVGGNIAVDGVIDYEGLTFTGESIVELTGSNTFGATASFNQHTFTGSVVISSSQTNAFEVIGNVEIPNLTVTDGIVTRISPNGNFVNLGNTFLKKNVFLGAYNGSTVGGTKVFIEAFSTLHPYAHIISGKDDENDLSGFKLQTRSTFGAVEDNLTLKGDTKEAIFAGDVSALSLSTTNNINASGLLFASASLKPNSASLRTVLYDSSSGRFYYTGSYGVGSGGEGVGFPFTGSAQITGSIGITGSLSLTGSSPFIQIDSSSVNYTGPQLHNRDGDLFWGNTNVAAVGSGITAISQDTSPILGGNLNLLNFDVTGTEGASILLSSTNNSNTLLLSSSGIILNGSSIIQTGAGITNQFVDTIINSNLEVTNNITASNLLVNNTISASNIIVNTFTASNGTVNGNLNVGGTLSGTNINFDNLSVGTTVIDGGLVINTINTGETSITESYLNFPHQNLLFLNDNADNLANISLEEFAASGFFSTAQFLVDNNISTANTIVGINNANAGVDFESLTVSNNTIIQNNALNIIWDFETAVLLDSFRIEFSSQKGASISNAFKFIEIFGSNFPFLENISSVGPQTNVSTGEYQLGGSTGMLLNRIENPLDTSLSNNINNPSLNVIGQEVTASNIGLGVLINQNTSPNTTVDQTFRYYRLRFSGSVENAPRGLQLFREITPVTRSFTTNTFEITSDCVSVCSASVAISASYASMSSTASYAIFSETSSHAIFSETASFALNAGSNADAFPFIGDAEITGSLEVFTPGETIVTTTTTTETVGGDGDSPVKFLNSDIKDYTSSQESYPYKIMGMAKNDNIEFFESPDYSGEFIQRNVDSDYSDPANPVTTFAYGNWNVVNNGPDNTFHPGFASSLNIFEDTDSYIDLQFLKGVNEFGTNIKPDPISIDVDFQALYGITPKLTSIKLKFPPGYGSNKVSILGSNINTNSDLTPNYITHYPSWFTLYNEEPGFNNTLDNSRTIEFENTQNFRWYRISFNINATLWTQFGTNPFYNQQEDIDNSFKFRISNIQFFSNEEETITTTTTTTTTSPGTLVSISSGSVTASNGFLGDLTGTASNAISSSHALIADFALNVGSTGDDGDWFIEPNHLTSSKNVLITGSLDILDPDFKEHSIFLNSTASFRMFTNGKGLVIGSDSSPAVRKIKFIGAQGDSLTINTPTTSITDASITTPLKTSIKNELTASKLNLDLITQEPYNHVLMYDVEGKSVYYTSSRALSDGDWFIGNGYLTSSRNVHITKSLFVASNATIGNNTITPLFTSSKAIVQQSLVIGAKSTLNELDITQAPLTVRDNIFLVNNNDAAAPKNEGILFSTHGTNNTTGGRIFFTKTGDSSNGLSLIYNAGQANSILDMPANSFAIRNHNNKLEGSSNLTLDLTNSRVGINIASPEFDLDVEKDIQARNNLYVGNDISCSNNIVANGDIYAKGNIFAEQYILTSSTVHYTQSFSEGSTQFGDTQDDIHLFIGTTIITGSLVLTGSDTHLTASGNISASGYVSASHFHGTASGLTEVPVFITGSSGYSGNPNDPLKHYAKTFNKLHFDYHTGIHVSESSPDTAFISLGSAFHIFSASNESAISTGSDEIIFEAGDNMDVQVTLPNDPNNSTGHHKITFTSDGGGVGFPYSGSDSLYKFKKLSPTALAKSGSKGLIGSEGSSFTSLFSVGDPIQLISSSIGIPPYIFTSKVASIESNTELSMSNAYSGSTNPPLVGGHVVTALQLVPVTGNPQAVITGSLLLSGSGHITASGNVFVSGGITTNTLGAEIISASIINTNTLSASSFIQGDIIFANEIIALTGSGGHGNIWAQGYVTASSVTASEYARGAFVDDFNTLNASSTRPVLTIKNRGGDNRSFLDTPVDNADAFIKLEASRSNSHYSVGIDSHDGSFKITSGSFLNENNALNGSNGFPTFRIQDDKVGIRMGSTVTYPLDVNGDIRSAGTLRVDKIKGASLGTFGNEPYFNSLTIESNITASSNISASGYLSASNVWIDDDLTIGGNIDFDGFTFIDNIIASLTGSNSFGETASFNQHTFTGSITISSSQTNVFTIINSETVQVGDSSDAVINTPVFNIQTNGTITTPISTSNDISSSGDLIINNITASSDISSSGMLFFSSSFNSNTSLVTLVYDTASGEIFYTGSYGSGGGGSGKDNDWEIEATRLTSSKDIKVDGGISASGDLAVRDTITRNISSSVIRTGFINLQPGASIFASHSNSPTSTTILRTDYPNSGLSLGNQEYPIQLLGRITNKITASSGIILAEKTGNDTTSRSVNQLVLSISKSVGIVQNTGFSGNIGSPEIKFGNAKGNIGTGSLMRIVAEARNPFDGNIYHAVNKIETNDRNFIIQTSNNKLDNVGSEGGKAALQIRNGLGSQANKTCVAINYGVGFNMTREFQVDGDSLFSGDVEVVNGATLKVKQITSQLTGNPDNPSRKLDVKTDITSSGGIVLNSNHQSLVGETDSGPHHTGFGNPPNFIKLNVGSNVSHSIIASSNISSSGVIYGKQRETTCNNHATNTTSQYYIPFVTDQELLLSAQQSDEAILRTSFVAPYNGKIIKMIYHPLASNVTKGQIVGTPRVNLYINGQNQGEANNGGASHNQSNQIYIDPRHRRFGIGAANYAGPTLINSSFRTGDIIRISIDRFIQSGFAPVSVRHILCSVVFEYEYNDEGY